jgi:adenylate cyclase
MERENTPVRNEEATFEKLDGFIDGNLENADYSIKELCEDLGYSRSQLFRLVKERSGLSPSLYIRQRRLLRAKALLADTDWRIAEITDKVGLDSQQTFTKYFTQEFGVSPTEYRKNLPHQPATDAPATEPPIPAAAEEVTPGSPGTASSRKRTALLAGLLLMVAGGYFAFYKNPPVIISGVFENSIAILPFRSPETEGIALLADGLTGQVHSSLAGVQHLKVISRTSSELFINSQKTIPQMAAELGVDYILVGTVTQVDQKVRVNVELIKAAEDRTLWAQNYEGGEKELLAFMNSVARRITLTLDQPLTDSESRKLDRLPTDNLDAFREYQLGKQLMLSRQDKKLLASIERFDRAIALDPDFADAYAYKASAYFLLGSDNFMDLNTSIRLSEQNALTAIRLDGENGLAYATLANGYRQLNRWEQAITTYQIALKHTPNDAQINYWYSISLRALGQFDEAIRYGNRALTLDPLYPTIVAGHVGNFSYAGRFDEARQLIQESEPLLDKFYMYYYVRAFYYLNRGEHRPALREFTKSDSLNPGFQLVEVFMLYCRTQLGERAPAEARLRALTDIPDHYVYKAILYAGLRDRENCLRYLELGVPLGIAPEYLKISPLFRFLHGDARFQEILRQLGLLDPLL